MLELRERNKIRKLWNGSTRGRVLLTQGPLFYLLHNRFYIGPPRRRRAAPFVVKCFIPP